MITPAPNAKRRSRGSACVTAGFLLVCGALASCDQGPDDQAPQAVGTISDLTLVQGRTAMVDVASHFSDPEGGALTFGAASSNSAVAMATVSGSVVTIASVSAGAIKVVVTAMDPAGQSAQQEFGVAVPATPVVELTTPMTSGPESGMAVLPLSLSVPPAEPITVTWSLGPDSDAGTHDADPDDFAGGFAGSFEIPAGATEAAIEVVFNDDEDIEPTREAFTLTLDAPAVGAGYTVGPRRRATGVIAEGVCDRTPEVQDAILLQILPGDCAAVQDEDLGRVRGIAIPAFQRSGGRTADSGSLTA